MIRCKTCSKFARMEAIHVNGLEETSTIGSCKHCGYQHEVNRVEYDDWEELGIDY
jgi:hypothetical protein